MGAAGAAWYVGIVAGAGDRVYRSAKLWDSSGEKHGGLLTDNDLAQWSDTVEAPATYDYHGYTVAKCGPWSQGPLMLQQLALLRDIPLAEMAADGPEFVHTMVEAAKLAFADRGAWLRDGDGFSVAQETQRGTAACRERGGQRG